MSDASAQKAEPHTIASAAQRDHALRKLPSDELLADKHPAGGETDDAASLLELLLHNRPQSQEARDNALAEHQRDMEHNQNSGVPQTSAMRLDQAMSSHRQEASRKAAVQVLPMKLLHLCIQ